MFGKKRRPSKTASWLSRAMASTTPLKVAFTKDNPSDKKVAIIFMHDHDAEKVNGDSKWFGPPWQEMEVDGQNRWCLFVEPEPPGKKYNMKPAQKPGGEEGEEGEEQDEDEQKEDGDEPDPTKKPAPSKPKPPKETKEEKEELEKIKKELLKNRHDLFKKEPEKREEKPMASSGEDPAEPPEEDDDGESRVIGFGLTDLCFCRACQKKRSV